MYLPYCILKFKIGCLPVQLLSIAFSDSDVTLLFCLPYPKIITLHQAGPGKQQNQNAKGCMECVGLDIVT